MVCLTYTARCSSHHGRPQEFLQEGGKGKGKGKGQGTCYSAAYMSQTRDQQRFTISKWQLIGMSQWCRSALSGHPFPALTHSWTHGAVSRHTIAPISHTRPSPRPAEGRRLSWPKHTVG